MENDLIGDETRIVGRDVVNGRGVTGALGVGVVDGVPEDEVGTDSVLDASVDAASLS